MKSKKNALLIAAGICLLILAILCAGYSIASGLGLLRFGRNGYSMTVLPGDFQPGQPQTGNGDSLDIPEDYQAPKGQITPPAGETDQNQRTQGQFPRGNMPEGGFQGREFPSGAMPGGFAMRGFGILNWLGPILYGLALVLAIISAIGIFKAKKWAAIVGIILAGILLLVSAFGLFRFISWIVFSISMVKVILAAAVIVLLLLPGARQLWAVKEDDLLDEDDDDEDEDNPAEIECEQGK